MDLKVDPGLYQEVKKFGARDMEICMQCGLCSSSCPLSSGQDSFPRKIYRYLQLGLKDRLLSSPVPWLCYYCGECNNDCPRGAEPAETMMATRRWLTTEYDWTGLAKKLYLSTAWEIGALSVVAFVVIMLFVLFHGPIITDRVAVNTFAPVKWIEIGDLVMAAILSSFLLTNAFRMFRFIMGDTRPPLSLYISEAKTFVLHLLTQMRWRECSEDKSRWLKHFILVSGYLTMMSLIIVFIRWFQVDDSSWHFSSIFGYYATGTIMGITAEMMWSRYKKREEAIHRYTEPSDWLFLILLFLSCLTGIVMHGVRLAGWPMGTYVMYVVHLAFAVPMLVIEVPFGKWSHLFYRPLAMFLTRVKEKASEPSSVDVEEVVAQVGDTFLTCIQCGTCTTMCPWNLVSSYRPRQIMRHLNLESGNQDSVDRAVWTCVTCNACGVHCPRGIDIIDVMKTVRGLGYKRGLLPERLEIPLESMRQRGNPWNGPRERRMEWAQDLNIPRFSPDHEYCLFTCCTTAYDPNVQESGRSLPQLLERAGILFGTLGTEEVCCGDHAHKMGAEDLFEQLAQSNTRLFKEAGVKRLLTTSPHCLNAFRNLYSEIKGQVVVEHYTELLWRLIEKGRLIPTLDVSETVTYHDPCYLGRHNSTYDAPRNILKSIPGLRFVEMASNREQSLCCGGGGGGAWTDVPPEEGFGILRVKEAMDCGAGVIATACPYCIRILNQAVGELNIEGKIVVKDVAELLLQSVGHWDGVETFEGSRPRFEQEGLHV